MICGQSLDPDDLTFVNYSKYAVIVSKILADFYYQANSDTTDVISL